MKTHFVFLAIAFCFFISPKLFAVHFAAAPNAMKEMTVYDFLELHVDSLADWQGKEISHSQKTRLLRAQDQLRKKVNKGRLDPEASLEETIKNMQQRRGFISLLLVISGLILMFIPIAALGGLSMFVTGFILGITGISIDPNPTLAIVSTVLGAVIIVAAVSISYEVERNQRR